MREYGQISPSFWIGKTGKQLRGNPSAQVLALYLMSSPHSTMTGVFHCPVLYMAHETGLGMEVASDSLNRLIELGFCEYDEPLEYVFVLRMAAFQIAESLKPGDNRIAGLRKEVAKMASISLRDRFLDEYGQAFSINIATGDEENSTKGKPLTSPLEGASKPLTSPLEGGKTPLRRGYILRAGAGAGVEAPPPPPRPPGGDATPDATPSATPTTGRRLPESWAPSEKLQSWAKAERPDLDIAATVETFTDYWRAKPGKDGRKLDWDATFRNWVRTQNNFAGKPKQINGFEGGI